MKVSQLLTNGSHIDEIYMHESLDLENPNSFGLQLVTTFVDQLDRELELKRNIGTEFTMRFTLT
jgi:two-component sensor histidine kinase